MCVFVAKSIKRRWSVIFCGPSTHKMFEGAMRHDAAAHVRRGKRLRPFYGLNSPGIRSPSPGMFTSGGANRSCEATFILPRRNRKPFSLRDFLPVCFYIQSIGQVWKFAINVFKILNPIRPAAVKFVNSLDGTKALRLFNNCFARVVVVNNCFVRPSRLLNKALKR